MNRDGNYLLLGGGGQARVLLDTLKAANQLHRVVGLLDPQAKNLDSAGYLVPVLGDEEGLVSRFPAETTTLINGLGSIGRGGGRRTLYENYQREGYGFATILHPRAVIGGEVRLGEGCQVMAGAILQTGCQLGENSLINTGAMVDHDGRIGPHVHIAPGAVLSGGVTVGAGSHIGCGATVIQGITIGAGVTVGAGAVVVDDLPAGVTAVGVPAAVITVKS